MFLITSNHLKMKKVLLLLLVAATFASCTKEASVSSLDSQKGKKVKYEALTVAVTTSVPVDWTTEDAIVSIDSANWNGSGNNIYWSVRSDVTPSIQMSVEVYIEANWVDKFGVSDPNAHWATIGSLWDGGSIVTNPAAGSFFDGYPGQVETRVYRGKYTDGAGVTHISSPYQVN
jgi:hypothetical protein